MNTARSKKSIPMRPDRNVRRQQATAINLAKGMSIEKAMLQAGYSPSYAHDQGYKSVKRPCIQSIFTDSCQRIMDKRAMKFDAIMEPIFDALTAKVIVRSTQLGDAQEVDLPDYPIRMSAADRLIELYGGTEKIAENSSPPVGLVPRFDTSNWSEEDWADFRRLRDKSKPTVIDAS